MELCGVTYKNSLVYEPVPDRELTYQYIEWKIRYQVMYTVNNYNTVLGEYHTLWFLLYKSKDGL